MKTYIQKGDSFQITAAAALTAGTPILWATGVVVVPMQTVASGALVEVLAEGIADLPKAAVTITVGQLAYWDNTAKLVTNVSSSNTKFGIFVRAQASGDALARVRMNGAF